MEQRSIAAYDLVQRVASYDHDMELRHPNRSKNGSCCPRGPAVSDGTPVLRSIGAFWLEYRELVSGGQK